jgi:hypothetical protein
MNSKTKILLIAAAAAVVLYLVFANRAGAATSPIILPGGIAAHSPGSTSMATTASALTNLENSLGSIFSPSSVPVSQQGIQTAQLVDKTAGLSVQPSTASSYGVAQALVSQSSGAATPVVNPQLLTSSAYATSNAPVISDQSGGSFDLNALTGNSFDVPAPMLASDQSGANIFAGATSYT